jgi:hypothetical protein
MKEDELKVFYQIIASGVNYLSKSEKSDDIILLDKFTSNSFDVIMGSWPFLNDKVQFLIFKKHLSSFQTFMASNKNV